MFGIKPRKIKGLLDRGTYLILNENNLPAGAIVSKSTVVHAIKKNFSGKKNIRRGWRNKDMLKGKIVKEAPTIIRSSTGVILTISASMNFKIWSRNVRRAFIQSEDGLHR